MKRKLPGRKQRARPSQPGTAGVSREELNAESRALLGREEKPRGLRPEPREDASVEDPLRDWPGDD